LGTHPIFLNGEGVPSQKSGNFWIVLEEKRREITKERIDSGRIEA